jgi:hypothetical protein
VRACSLWWWCNNNWWVSVKTSRKPLHFISNRTKTPNQDGWLNFGNIAKVGKA